MKWRVVVTYYNKRIDKCFHSKSEAVTFFKEEHPEALYVQLFKYVYPNWKLEKITY